VIALAARGLTKRYGHVAAVDGLDLAIEEGTLYGFLGPNGAGKTTTLRMALALVFPTSGQVEVLGRPVFRDGRIDPESMGALRSVGALVEEPAFWKYLSGRKNLECVARAAGPAADRDARLSRIDEALRVAGLEGAANKRVKAYSQGMRQRLGIASALLGRPRLLLLDEPSNGLDPQGTREVRTMLRRLADEGTTVFVSSHLLAEVEAMCDRVGVLARGRLVAEGPPSNLRPSGTRVRVDVDDMDRAARVAASLQGVAIEDRADGAGSLTASLAPPATAASLNAALVQSGVKVSALVPVHERLEDVFVELVEGADEVR
jgi:ABC-2 type transport system ATP-binding protein